MFFNHHASDPLNGRNGTDLPREIGSKETIINHSYVWSVLAKKFSEKTMNTRLACDK